MQDQPDRVTPTPERSQHSGIEILDRAIADDAGRPSQPYRSIDILDLLERRGTITHGMWLAGNRFRSIFRLTQLDPLRASDLGRTLISGGRPDPDLNNMREKARDSAWRALLAVGGIASPGGSCIYTVLGWERTIKDWAFERSLSGDRVSQDVAKGIFISALGALESHYERGA
jgi:hypothetical protein